MEKENNRPKTGNNAMGLGIAIGAGLGIIFGEMLFDNVGVGLSVGAGLGIAFAGVLSRESKNNSKKGQ